MNVAEYHANGFTVLRGAIDFGFAPGTMDLLCNTWKRLPRDEYLRAARRQAKGLLAHGVFLAPAIQRAVSQIGIREPLMLTHPAVHVMGVDPNWDGVSAHQDWTALQSGLNTVVVWIPFTDVGLENYPVEFVRGSHLEGLMPAKPGAHYSEVETDGLEFEPVPVKAGDAILFSAFTLHRTRLPGTGFRLAVSHRYEDASDPWFKEHHDYSAQRTVIERAVKDAPTREQVQAVFKYA